MYIPHTIYIHNHFMASGEEHSFYVKGEKRNLQSMCRILWKLANLFMASGEQHGCQAGTRHSAWGGTGRGNAWGNAWGGTRGGRGIRHEGR